MKKAFKILSLTLAVLVILGTISLASCGEEQGGGNDSSKVAEVSSDATPEGEKTVDNTEEEATETEPEDTGYKPKKLAEGKNLNSNGTNEFTVYMRSESELHYAGLYIIPDEDKSDVINQSAVSRNQVIEEQFDIELKKIETDCPDRTLKEDYSSGEYTYDLILTCRCDLGGYALGGYMLNLNNLAVDYTADWWEKNAYKAYTISNKLFLMANDVSVSNLGGTRFWFFNKQVLSDFKLESPYEYALKDQWTLETFSKYVKSVSAPGADGTYGTYGLIYEKDNNFFNMLVGIGVPWSSVDNSGNLICEIGSTYAERTQEFIDAFSTIVENRDYVLDYSKAGQRDKSGVSYSDMYTRARGLFNQDHFLFIMSNMNCAVEFGECEMGYGVIMNPKFNTDQDQYYHMMDVCSIIWGAPNIGSINTERLAAVMDYWAYVSHTTVMEAYYELTLKTKRASDPTAANMLDTIKGSIRYFPTDLYGDSVSRVVKKAFTKTVATAWAEEAETLQGKLDKIITSINSID